MLNAHAFIAAIRDTPDDDTPRLVFSDWLEDHGEPARAELIRVQCELACLPTFDPRYPELHLRQLELLAEHEADWLGEWADRLVRWEFRRGLLHAVTITPEPFVERGEELFREHPVERVALVNRHGESLGVDAIAAVVAAPAMAQVRALETAGCRRGEPMCGMYGGIVATNDWLSALARAHHVVRLEELHLNGDTRCGALPIDRNAWRGFCKAQHLRSLRHLDLRDAYPQDEAEPLADVVRLLATATFVRNLRALTLAGCHAGDEAARQLAAAPLEHLESLDLEGCTLGSEATRAILAAPALGRLRSLALTCSVRLEELAASPSISPLSSLRLREGQRRVQADEWVSLFGSDRVQNLTELALTAHGSILPVAGMLLAPWTANLRVLALACESLTAADLAPLFARGTGPTPLHSLSLPDCAGIGAALANWPGLAGLTDLNLTRNYDQECADDTGQLLGSRHLSPRLARLDLSGSCRTEANAKQLANCPALAGLRWLGFGWNNLVVERMRTLLHSPCLQNIEALHLFSEFCEGDGTAEYTLAEIANARDWWPRLRDVVLGSQTPREALALLREGLGPRLRVWSDC